MVFVYGRRTSNGEGRVAGDAGAGAALFWSAGGGWRCVGVVDRGERGAVSAGRPPDRELSGVVPGDRRRAVWRAVRDGDAFGRAPLFRGVFRGCVPQTGRR